MTTVSEVQVGTQMNENWFTHAGMGLQLPASTSKSGIVKAALALFHGMDITEARALAVPKPVTGKGIGHGEDKKTSISCKVPAELANVPEGYSIARAIRIGTLIAMGYSREAAEEFSHMPKTGRPRKNQAA